MISRFYKFKFYINAKHYLDFENGKNNIHPHTWEILLFLIKEEDKFIKFDEIEQTITDYLSQYENSLLNEMELFNGMEPSTEIIGEVFFSEINEMLLDKEWKLTTLEISENPSRTYVISSPKYRFSGYNPLKHKKVSYKQSLKEDESNEKNQKIQEIKEVKEIKEVEEVKETEEVKEVKVEKVEKETYEKVDSETIASEIIISNENTEETLKGIKEEVAATVVTISDMEVSQRRYSRRKRKRREQEKKFKQFMFNMFIVSMLLLGSTLIFYFFLKEGRFPWGSDTWGHLFKGHFLYKEFMKGNVYPLYTELWYNGIQPFRYWAPFPYYILLILEIITKGNSLLTFYLFVGITLILGSIPWVLLGREFKKKYLGVILGILWFFLPDNLRVFFCEGNIPRVVVTTFFPYLLYIMTLYLHKKKKRYLSLVYLLMFLITLSHAMISAMTGITIFLYLLFYGIATKEYKEGIEILISAVLGIVTSSIWLYPALKGGIVSLDKGSVSNVMERLTYNISQSLNPFFRLQPDFTDGFYFGVSIILISILGILFSNLKGKVGFTMTILIFLGTTKALLPFFRKLPMSELFWMMRFTPMAMGFFFLGLMYWSNIKKNILVVFIILIAMEGIYTLQVIHLSVKEPRIIKDVEYAVEVANKRIALLDLSTFDSDASYNISYNKEDKNISQIFGWAWQGATTAENIVWINTALENKYYVYVFDRCLELGADVLIIKKRLIDEEVEGELQNSAEEVGYEKIYESEDNYIYKYPANRDFATKVYYEGLAIGKYASNITYAFPKFQVGDSEYLDDYDEKELKKYKTIFLSGFSFRDKNLAEELVKRLSTQGVRFVIDLTGLEDGLLNSRASFLGVMGEPIEFRNQFPGIKVDNGDIKLKKLPDEYSVFRTIYLENLDEIYGYAEFEKQVLDCWGNKYNENINFLGMNVSFLSFINKDEAGIQFLEKILQIKAYEKPKREIVHILKSHNKNSITISAEKDTLMDLAYLDAFKVKGNISKIHNLVKMEDEYIEIQVFYPHIKKGAVMSCIGVLLFTLFILSIQFNTKILEYIKVNRWLRGYEG